MTKQHYSDGKWKTCVAQKCPLEGATHMEVTKNHNILSYRDLQDKSMYDGVWLRTQPSAAIITIGPGPTGRKHNAVIHHGDKVIEVDSGDASTPAQVRAKALETLNDSTNNVPLKTIKVEHYNQYLSVNGARTWLQGKQLPIRRKQVENCATCVSYANDKFAPPHDASSRCESGKHPHCTCDTCF